MHVGMHLQRVRLAVLPDIQDELDPRGIEIDRVGIAGVRYPTRFNDGSLEQAGIATFEMTVALSAERRGTHMSRMVEVIHENMQELDPRLLPVALKAAASRLDACEIEVRVSLPIATLVTAPASNRSAWQTSDLELVGVWSVEDGCRVETSVTSEVTSLCPCSKAISDYGAHNQRSSVRLTIVGHDDGCYPLDVSRAIGLIREIGSCPIYPIVKRPDERLITMEAFDHPVFVEDMVRDLSTGFRRQRIWHSIRVQNFESIHSHDAVAQLSWCPGR